MQTRLYIPVRIQVGSEFSREVMALVDTDCESNLVRLGVVPPKYFHPVSRPVNFVAANKIAVQGGRQELFGQIVCEAIDWDTGLTCPLQLSFICLEADIGGGDLVISYKWLAQNHIDVIADKHGLMAQRTEGPLWIAGAQDPKGKKQVQAIQEEITGSTDTVETD